MESMTDDIKKRDRGILTEADREYLRNPEEYSRQASHNREGKIRERLGRAFEDFPLLATELDDETLDELLDRESGFSKLNYPAMTKTTTHARETLVYPYIIKLLLKIYFSTRPNPIPRGAMIAPFERDIEHGLELYLNDNDLAADVDVSITVENIHGTETLLDDLRDRDEPLDGHERVEAIKRLSRAGYSTEEITDVVEEPDADSEET
jgi:hypothetical protein